MFYSDNNNRAHTCKQGVIFNVLGPSVLSETWNNYVGSTKPNYTMHRCSINLILILQQYYINVTELKQINRNTVHIFSLTYLATKEEGKSDCGGELSVNE